MFWLFAYVALRCVFGLLVLVLRGERATQIEVLVLRHQVAVLRCQVHRPDLHHADRVLLTALSRVLRRSCWGAFFVTPATLLRWHRNLIARIQAPRANAICERWIGTLRRECTDRC